MLAADLPDQAKRDDGRVAVLLDADVLGRVRGRRLGGIRTRVQAGENLGLVRAHAGRARVDEVVRPEAVVDRDVVARGAVEEVFEQRGQLGRSRRLFGGARGAGGTQLQGENRPRDEPVHGRNSTTSGGKGFPPDAGAACRRVRRA